MDREIYKQKFMEADSVKQDIEQKWMYSYH